FELLRYNEYKKEVLELAAILMDSGLIGSKELAPYKTSLLIEFRDEYKRDRAGETRKSYSYYSHDDEEGDDNQENYGSYNTSETQGRLMQRNSRRYYAADDDRSDAERFNKAYSDELTALARLLVPY